MISTKPFAAMLCPVLLAACSAGVVSTEPEFEITGLLDVFQYAASGRDLRAEIRGNPTSAPKDAFDAAVVATMQGSNGGPKTHFTTMPSANARTDYRVVMVFTGNPRVSGRAACGDLGAGAIVPTGDRVHVRAAFCYRTQTLAHIGVSTGPLGSPGDPRLGAVVRLAMHRLFPAVDPERSTNGGDQFD